MADYTKLTQKIVKKLLGQYDLGALEAMTVLDGGQANSSVKLKTRTGLYTLSVCDEKNTKEITCQTRVLTWLETQDFPTTRLVPAQNGEPFIIHKGKPVYIKEFIEGQVCPCLTSAMLFQVGQAMARLHSLTPPPHLPGQFPYGLNTFEEIFDAPLSHPYVDWLKQKKNFLESAIDPSMSKGFIHGDIFWDNLVFSKDSLVAILDFEEACYYYKLYDIGMCTVGCCTQKGLFDMTKVKQLLTGYQQACPLTEAAKQQLKIFMEYAAVAASFWRFRQYNLRYPSQDKKDNYQELASLADQIHGMDEKRFSDIFTA
jgi:homoserine kinase type II